MLIRTRSISFRLTTWFLSIFFLGWVLFGAAMWLDLQHSLDAVRSQTLDHRVDRLSQLLRDSQNSSFGERAQKFKEFANATGDGLIEVFDANGSNAYPSPSAIASTFPWPQISEHKHKHFSKVSFSGQPYLVLVRPVSIGSQSLNLCVAASLTNNRLLLQRFSTGLLASMPVLLILSAASGYFISRKALVPVDRITASVQSISVSNLSNRLPVIETGDELQRLAETFNAMLARMESAVNQIRQFTGDASHELRGPISYMRTVAEVALRNKSADKESCKAFSDIVAESATASVLLEDMLTLARADSGDSNTIFEVVDLAELLQEVCEKIRPMAEAKQHTLAVHLESHNPVEVTADYNSISRLVWILLDNAVKYTPSPGLIEATLNSTSGQATIAIKDNGIGIAETDLPLIFQRFFRADPSRSHVDGTGLGLAIAKWIADVHHASLVVSSKRSIGTVCQVVMQMDGVDPSFCRVL